MIPVSEDRRRYNKKEKLPTKSKNKYQRPCPICGAPYINTCLKCYYKHTYNIKTDKDKLFKKANE